VQCVLNKELAVMSKKRLSAGDIMEVLFSKHSRDDIVFQHPVAFMYHSTHSEDKYRGSSGM
jgi:hypothetical protein